MIMKFGVVVALVALTTGIEARGPPGRDPPGPPSGRGARGAPYPTAPICPTGPRPTPSYTFYVPLTVSGSQPPSQFCLCFSKMCPGGSTISEPLTGYCWVLLLLLLLLFVCFSFFPQETTMFKFNYSYMVWIWKKNCQYIIIQTSFAFSFLQKNCQKSNLTKPRTFLNPELSSET